MSFGVVTFVIVSFSDPGEINEANVQRHMRCYPCDGFLYRGKHVLVVGGGDSAAEEALVLARTSASVRATSARAVRQQAH